MIVQGSKEQAKPLIVGKTTVYVHTNIKQIDDNLYEYEEQQYTKDEYIKLLSDINKSLSQQIDVMQMVLTEMYEGVDE